MYININQHSVIIEGSVSNYIFFFIKISSYIKHDEILMSNYSAVTCKLMNPDMGGAGLIQSYT